MIGFLRYKFLGLLIFALCPMFSQAFSNPPRPTYRVLLVGIGKYSDRRFSELDGDKDVEMIAKVLTDSWGVNEKEEITVLNQPENTTKAKIMQAMQEKLVDPAKKGDVIYFGYSGHGCQVVDKTKPTGLSQAIVPIDLQREANGDLKTSSLITGPEIGAVLKQLKDKGVTNVTLTFDSCHSGSVTRGLIRPKGADNPAVVRFLKERGAVTADPIVNEPGLKGYVCISAARADQTAWEGPEGGNLTVALQQVFRDIAAEAASKKQAPSYAALYSRIQTRMTDLPNGDKQNPVLEGDADRRVFGSTFTKPSSSYPTYFAGNELRIRAGEAHGLKTRALIGLYVADTEDFSGPPIATALVADVRIAESGLKLTEESEKALGETAQSKLAAARAIVLDNTPDGKLKVYFEPSTSLNSVIEPTIKALSILTLSTNPKDYDVKVDAPRAKGTNEPLRGWTVLDNAGEVIASNSALPEVASEDLELKRLLTNLSRKKAVMALGPSDSDVAVTVEIRLVRVKTLGPKHVYAGPMLSTISDKSQTPLPSLGPEDYFAIQVSAIGANGRKGAYDPYISVLDILPNSKVTQLWPDPKQKVNDEDRRIVADGKWRWLSNLNSGLTESDANKQVINVFEVNPQDGVGLEHFKMIATKEPADFAPMLTPERARGRGPSHRLEKLLQAYTLGEPVTRSGSVGSNISEWSVAKTTVRVIKKRLQQ